MSIAEHLVPYVQILRESFPAGVHGDRRGALLAALYDEFSDRNLSEVLEGYFAENRHELLAEAIRARNTQHSAEEMAEIRRVLLEHGWSWDFDE